jgi:hypothetical protein
VFYSKGFNSIRVETGIESPEQAKERAVEIAEKMEAKVAG